MSTVFKIRKPYDDRPVMTELARKVLENDHKRLLESGYIGNRKHNLKQAKAAKRGH